MISPTLFTSAACTSILQTGTTVAPIVIDAERSADIAAREALLDRSFGPARFRKTCHKLRAGRLPASGLSLVARAPALGCGAVGEGDIVGTVRLWHIEAGVPALMLGPLAVDARCRGLGLGGRLMNEAIGRARVLGHRAILLVGDAPYYARFGFDRCLTLGLRMPGPVDAERFLGLGLAPDALAAARGVVRATGAIDLTFRRRPRAGVRLRRAA